MIFTRRAIVGVPRDHLRILAARTGWLLEHDEMLRAGLGPSVIKVEPGSLSPVPRSISIAFGDTEIDGPSAPFPLEVTAFGSLPFDPTEISSLDVPAIHVVMDSSGVTWALEAEGHCFEDYFISIDDELQEVQEATSVKLEPTPDSYMSGVARIVEMIHQGKVDKVVLARSISGTVEDPIDVASIARRLRRRETHSTIYAMPLRDGSRYVGASPELLVRYGNGSAVCHPLAGTISIPQGSESDEYENWLLGSSKNRFEHQVLVQEITENMKNYFQTVTADEQPSIVRLRTIAHLGSWITAKNPVQESIDCLTILSALHPTAAVAGRPRATALETLRSIEGVSRGHYAGPIGWIDQTGAGEWWIGIRGALVNDRTFTCWAGAGIVGESDPVAEREETRDKIRSTLSSVATLTS